MAADVDAPHILVVDDDTRLRKLLNDFLTRNGYLVTVAEDAAEARERLSVFEVDLIVMDVMMPGESGLELTRSLRARSEVPILMLTAMGESADRIAGLKEGVDDYLTKPFEADELLLRINAILRRVHRPAPASQSEPLRFGAHTYDPAREELTGPDGPVHLSTAERDLLAAFAARPGETLSREVLAEATGSGANPRTVDVQVTRLRKKIETDPKLPRYLQTVRGRGYLLKPD